MKKILFLTVVFISIATFAQTIKTPDGGYVYETAKTAWDEALGNHRAIVHVTQSDNAALLNFYWRRPDKDVANRRFVIINAANGDTVKNINRIEVSNEVCKIQFGPVTKGKYYFYYLPYQVQTDVGFYGKNYSTKEKAPDPDWLEKTASAKNISSAIIIKVESRTAFDSFYPMEVIATKNEMTRYASTGNLFYVFPEDRKYPIRMCNFLPRRWMSSKKNMEFAGTAMPNEYYAFQIGVWAARHEVKNVQYKASGFTSANGKTIPANAITCFNKEGVDPYGKAFLKKIDIAAGKVQALWFGIDIAANQPTGVYKGNIIISDSTGYKKIVPVTITVAGNKLADRGDSEPWRHSRLRWLNSTLGISDEPTKPYSIVKVSNNNIEVLGRTVTLDSQTGLPTQINSWQHDILAEPVRFVIQTPQGIKNIPIKISGIKHTRGNASTIITGEDADLKISALATIEFDGWMNYTYTINPKKNIDITDIRLEIPVKKGIASYFMGAGLPGQTTPKSFTGKWEANTPSVTAPVSLPTNKENSRLWPFDAFWIGNAHAGIHCELRGTTYSGPLLNLYRPAYPPSWYIQGNGGFMISQHEGNSIVTAYIGARNLKAGEDIDFEFALLITPVKQINYKSQFLDRYYHNGGKPVPTDEDVNAGVKIINVHHANYLNPVINYPFLTVDKLKKFTDEWHAKGVKVKIYYTIRELTSAVTEIWALRSLGDEILRGGSGGGFPWSREHFVADYTPQWYHHFSSLDETGFTADASVLTSTGDSRWYNYYVEGLAWLIKNTGIDGIYLDDVAFDRRMLKRMRRAMDAIKPGCIIDLHSNTGFSRGPATQYAEYFPYVDKIWFGESFIYNKMSPENWLVEVSGIPFGLMGDMLHGGGNRWLGMQYGMTVRLPWITEGVQIDPRPVWKVWDDFKIQDAKMIGFWEANAPVTSNDGQVKITSYIKPGATLLSIGNYSDETKEIKLNIDWQQLRLDKTKAVLIAPEIKDFQPAMQMNPAEVIKIEPRKGWLLYLQ